MLIGKNNFGLSEKGLKYMNDLFSRYSEIEKVIIYGSRATGHFQNGSDVDLVLMGDKIPKKVVSHIHFLLEEESPTLLYHDVLHFDSLKNEKLKNEIEEKGKVLYEKE
jgi:predicted nucleotidyltransferase